MKEWSCMTRAYARFIPACVGALPAKVTTIMGCNCSERGHRLFAMSVVVLSSSGCTLTDLSDMQGGSADAIEIASSSSSAGGGDVGGLGATSASSSGGGGGAPSASCTPLAG